MKDLFNDKMRGTRGSLILRYLHDEGYKSVEMVMVQFLVFSPRFTVT